jgi:hypothetical protein
VRPYLKRREDSAGKGAWAGSDREKEAAIDGFDFTTRRRGTEKKKIVSFHSMRADFEYEGFEGNIQAVEICNGYGERCIETRYFHMRYRIFESQPSLAKVFGRIHIFSWSVDDRNHKSNAPLQVRET